MGHGGIETVAKAAGVDRGRVSRGAQEVVVETITATTTRTGLSEHAELDPGAYPTGQTVSDAEMHTLAISPHHWHPEWNYTLHPRTLPPSPPKMSRRPERADPQWAAPAHLLVEVVSAICGKVLGGRLATARAGEAIAALPQLVIVQVGTAQLVDRMWELRGNLTVGFPS